MILTIQQVTSPRKFHLFRYSEKKASPQIVLPGMLQVRLATSYFRFDTIFGVQWLNFRVRDGNGCDPLAIGTNLSMDPFKNKTPAIE